jgi:hypothetical protein
MATTAWQPADEQAYKTAYLDGATNDELIQISGGTLNQVLAYNNKEQTAERLPRRNKPSKVKPEVAPSYNEALSLKGDRLIISDVHAPFHSQLWFNRLMKVKDKTGIGKLTIVGDGLDMHSFSGWGGDPAQPWSDESRLASDFVWRVYTEFDEITWIKGNYCDRISRKTDWQMSAEDPINAILLKYAAKKKITFTYDPDKLKFSSYPYAWLDDDWMLVHPRSYSRNPMTVARTLALKYQKHIIAAHGHMCGQCYALDGKHVAIDSGGLMDMNKVSYVNLSITTHPCWNNGFIVYRDGVADLLQEFPLTNWKRLYD